MLSGVHYHLIILNVGIKYKRASLNMGLAVACHLYCETDVFGDAVTSAVGFMLISDKKIPHQNHSF